MSDFCNVTVCGRMTEPKFTNVGEKQTLKATFSIAVNRFRKRSEAELQKLEDEAYRSGKAFDRGSSLFEKKTVWKKCIAWGKLAEQIKEYGKKGVRINANGDEDVEKYGDEEYQFVRLRVVNIFNLDKMNGDSSIS